MKWKEIKEACNCVKQSFDLPFIRDTPRTFVAKKARIEAKITPLSLIHPATANSLLILGASKRYGMDSREENDCYFPLNRYLIWSGAAALSLYVLSVLSKYILWWILTTNVKTPTVADRVVLLVLELSSLLLGIIELGALCILSIVLFPKLPVMTYKNRNDPHYCDYGMVAFSVIFFMLMWSMILFAFTAFVLVKCVRLCQKRRTITARKVEPPSHKVPTPPDYRSRSPAAPIFLAAAAPDLESGQAWRKEKKKPGYRTRGFRPVRVKKM